MSQTGLEICIDSLQSARNAAEGHCDQLEVCSALSLGGLTPSFGLVQSIYDHACPNFHPAPQLMVMLRPRGGDFVYNESDLAVMRSDLALFAEKFPSAGFVFGVLKSDNALDEAALAELVHVVGKGRKLTLHRAFDLVPDWREAVDTAVRLGFKNILTSGQKATAMEGKDSLAEIVAYAEGKGIRVIVGSGVKSSNIKELMKATKALWYHGSASVVVRSEIGPAPFHMGSSETDVVKEASRQEVAAMRDAIFQGFTGMGDL